MLSRKDIPVIIFSVCMCAYVLFATEKSVFWNSFFYVIIFGFILYSLIEKELPFISNKQINPVNWCVIIFTTEILLLMLFLSNKEYSIYYQYCTSDIISYVIAVSIAITLIITEIKRRRWKRKYGIT